MQKVLGDLSYVCIYLDDVLIFSEDVNEHAEHLREVLTRIRQAGLTLNSEKCVFGVEEVEFLGFRIREKKRSPKESTAKIIAGYPVPETTKALRSFLGLANFFQDLIPDFALLARPLFEACNKKKLVWTGECGQHFEELKRKLAAEPTTCLPNLNYPFIVASEASNIATGAVLLQEVEGQRRIIDFMSMAFNETEKRYSTIEREATAILWALEKWEHFLIGKRFKIETDHRPLQWLKTKIDLP